eukprot:scaffold14664_cov19-Tisochrysis_lutea.AAC.10
MPGARDQVGEEPPLWWLGSDGRTILPLAMPGGWDQTADICFFCLLGLPKLAVGCLAEGLLLLKPRWPSRNSTLDLAIMQFSPASCTAVELLKRLA